MKKSIITVSREFGSGGRIIGKMVADRLGIAYYDKEIIAKVAEKTGFAKEFIEKKKKKNGEYSPSKSIFAYAVVSRDRAGSSMNDYIYSVQRKIILDIAEKESCVIVGRCADDILSGDDKSLHVFIYADDEAKIKKIMDTHQVSEKEAVKLMKATDKKRSINYNYYTDKQWGRAHNYDLCLNSSYLGLGGTVELIQTIAAHKEHPIPSPTEIDPEG